MGSGKTSIGAKLSRYLRRQFVDSDMYIERMVGKSVKDIFASEGEEKFREYEALALQEIFSRPNQVVSLGGGAIVDPKNRALVRASSNLVTLLADLEKIKERIIGKGFRPLVDQVEDPVQALKDLWEKRKDIYLDSDFQVDTSSKSIDEIVREIIANLNLETIAYERLNLAINSNMHEYDIVFGDLNNINLKNLDIGKKILIVTQEGIPDIYLNRVQNSLNSQYKVFTLILPNGEKHKNFFSYQLIVQKLLTHKFERKDTVLALGGGVVGDLAGFAAATYYRGISFVQVPTTLLSMIDSSVGGKTGLNVPEGKNLIGAFYQPDLVQIDVTNLETLPEREFKSGLGELIKYALLGSQWDSLLTKEETFLEFIERNADLIKSHDQEIMQKLIRHCLIIKSHLVINDERENALRALLNLGHTFGHAIEEVTRYDRFSHGEAVGIGLVCACYLSNKINMLNPRLTEQLIKVMRDFDLEYQVPGDLDLDDLIEAMSRDKKMEAGKLKFILPKDRLGHAIVVKAIDNKLVKAALRSNQANG